MVAGLWDGGIEGGRWVGSGGGGGGGKKRIPTRRRI